jgi:hypothetical protein
MRELQRHITLALEHHAQGRRGYEQVREGLRRLAELTELAIGAAARSDIRATREWLEDLGMAASDLISSRGLAGTEFAKARQSVLAAQKCLESEHAA